MIHSNITSLRAALEAQTPGDIVAGLIPSMQAGVYIDPDTGNLISAPAGDVARASATYVPIPEGAAIRVDARNCTWSDGSVWSFGAYYDSGRNYISSMSFTLGQISNITPPGNAAFFRTTFVANWLSPQIIEIYTV